MLENLEPTPKLDAPSGWRPAVEFDGSTGEATTQGFLPDEKPDFDRFLIEAGFDPKEIEIVGEPRTSRWQVARPFPLDPQWLTAYRFRFVRRNATVDLPLLYQNAKKTRKTVSKNVSATGRAFVVVAADFQVGKNASRGGTPALIERVLASFGNIEQQLKQGKYEKVVIVDAGDIVESVSNTASFAQLQSNDLSPMQQVDLAAALMWDLLKIATKYAPTTYVSVGSNHCQWRFNGQTVGKPGVDDWGIVITQQLRRLATEKDLPVTFLIPQPHDESLAFDVFGDGFHVVGVAHGHQAKRPEQMPSWFEKQIAGLQAVASANILLTGHFHHLRVQQLGAAHNGGSRWWVQASTSDNGSDWFRLSSGQDSTTGVTCFELVKGKLFTGSVQNL